MKNIGKKWGRFAKSWLGNVEGRHCHWCKFMKSEDGEVTCEHPDSVYNDGDRIRSWDGEECAEKCGHFELNEYYTDDNNLGK